MMNEILDKHNITVRGFRRPNFMSILINSETNINVDIVKWSMAQNCIFNNHI